MPPSFTQTTSPISPHIVPLFHQKSPEEQQKGKFTFDPGYGSEKDPYPPPILTSILAVVSKRTLEARTGGRWGRWKAGRVSCLLGVVLSMLMESEAKHSQPPACVPARKGDEADCGGGGWLGAGSE